MAKKNPAGDLYALPLEEFTRARDALVKELRAAGKKDDAEAVRALKKPSVPAWALNQVARADARALEGLFDAADALRSAQRKLARGGDPSAVKEAAENERTLVAGLVSRAKEILRNAGNAANEPTLDRVADTLYASAVDTDVRDALREGRLVKEAKRVGFGEMPDLAAVPDAPAKTDKRSERASRARAEKEAAKLLGAAEEAESEAEAKERHAEDLAARAQRAREDADAAKEQARFARRAAGEARREADRAARALERRR